MYNISVSKQHDHHQQQNVAFPVVRSLRTFTVLLCTAQVYVYRLYTVYIRIYVFLSGFLFTVNYNSNIYIFAFAVANAGCSRRTDARVS